MQYSQILTFSFGPQIRRLILNEHRKKCGITSQTPSDDLRRLLCCLHMSVFNLFHLQKCVVLCVFLMFCILEAMSCCYMYSAHTQLWKINNKWSDYIPNEGKDIRRTEETAAKERMTVSSQCKAGWRRPRVAELLKSWTSCMFVYPIHITQFHHQNHTQPLTKTTLISFQGLFDSFWS